MNATGKAGARQMMPREMLQAMLDISSHMLESAQTENWTELESLEAIRADLITRIFSQPIIEEDKSFCAATLEKTLQINQTLARICVKQRDEMSQAVLKLRQGKRLKTTYGSE